MEAQVQEVTPVNTDLDWAFAEFTQQPEVQISNTMDVERILWALKRLDREEEALKKSKKEAEEFYKSRFNTIDDRREFLKGNIKGFMDSSKMDKVQLPSGTVSKTTRSKWMWPENSTELLSWLKLRAPKTVRIKEEVDKDAVKGWVAEEGKGEIPPMVNIEEVESIMIRRRG